MTSNLQFVSRAALVLALVVGSSYAAAIDKGVTAPAIAAVDANGRSVDVAILRGKVIYLDFWASWCAPCRRSFPWMNAMQEKYGAKGLVVIGINVDRKRADADRFLAQVPAQFAVAYDPEGNTPKTYAIKGMPSSVLIDREGRVIATHTGFRDEDREMLETEIRAVLP